MPAISAKSIDKAINIYFKRGNGTQLISKEKRLTTRAHGGLGQIDLITQTRLIQAKWVIKYHSGEDHLWSELWSLNIEELKNYLGTHTNLLYLDYNWARLNPDESWNLFPLTV